MSKIEISWSIDGGQISAQESVSGMIGVIESKNTNDSGTFWTFENEVSSKFQVFDGASCCLMRVSNTRGEKCHLHT